MFVMDLSKPVLVYLANGVQGSAVVRATLKRGFKARVLVRDKRRFEALQALGVELAEGDLSDQASLRVANRGVGHVVLQIPTGSEADMRAQTEHALAAAAMEGVQSLVLKLASASRPTPCSEPSFVANATVENLVRRSGIPFAIVRPTMYLDNLLKPSARADIVERGVFEPPIAASQRIAWTSADDCAEAAMTLLSNGVNGGDHVIAGPDSLTGDELVARITAGLDRPVVYRAKAMDAFEREVDAAMGPGFGRRVASKFRFFVKHRDEADAILAGPFARKPGLDGFHPVDVETWVRRQRSAFLGADQSMQGG
ncbi:NAD(P)H dehydrogenase (quinone) [Rhizobium sp. PP-CC-2G-626]|nr:NAD(P)H dehydrogenase (quinone) [Rhizobium sp. PP-CC-2G-626]